MNRDIWKRDFNWQRDSRRIWHMCELFGISAGGQVVLNDYLKEFFSHSTGHPNGWGMALLYGNAVNVEKEPVPAINFSS